MLFLCLFLTVHGFSVDNLIITQPLCSYSFGSIDFDVSGTVGTLNVSWTPTSYNGTHLNGLPNGTYVVVISDDLSNYSNTWDILTPAPLNITNQGPYWNTFGNWYKNLTEYVALSCTHTTNPDYTGYPGGYGRWNATKEFGKVVSGGTPGYSYLWTAPYGSFDAPTALYPYFYPDTPMVLFNLTLTVIDSQGCVADSVIPFVLQQLNPVIVLEPASINQSDGSFTVSFEGRYELSNFYFSFVNSLTRYLPNGYVYAASVNYPTDQTNSSFFGIMPAGNYQTIYEYSFGKCNSSFYFVIANKLTFSVGLPSFITSNASLSLVSDGTGPFSYLWSDYGLIDSTSLNPGFTTNIPVAYQLTVTDTNGVIGNLTTIFNPMKFEGLTTPIAYCQSYTPSLTVDQGLPPYTFNWTPSSLVSDSSILNPALILAPGTTQTLTLTVSDATGFQLSWTLTASRYTLSILSYDVIRDCSSTTGSIQNIMVTGTESTCWSLDSASGIGTSIPDINNLISGNYTLTLSCSDCAPVSTTIIIPENIHPVGILTTQIDYCSNFQLDLTGPVTSYLWTSTDLQVDIVSLTTFKPVIQTDLTQASLTLTVSSDTCSSSQSILFHFDADPVVIQISNNTCGASIILGSNVCTWSDTPFTGCNRGELSIGTYEVSYYDTCEIIRTSSIFVVSNCLDECPIDPLKVSPGQCGCGIPDLDEDQDGVAACLDECDTNCQTIGRCPNVTFIPGSIEVIIISGELDVTLQVDNTTIIRLEQQPLVEIDSDGKEIQSLSLNSIPWSQKLIRYSGYRLLQCQGQGRVKDQLVDLTWYYYFFDAYCTYPLEGIGLDPSGLTCSNTSFDSTDSTQTYVQPGDSKISFLIVGWPFEDESHRLRAELAYNISANSESFSLLKSTQSTQVYEYKLSDSLTLQSTYLTQCLLDGTATQVELQLNSLSSVQVIFPYFTESVAYDPLLSFLFSTSLVDTSSWFHFQAPLIAAGVALLAIIVFIGLYFTDVGFALLAGEEAARVKNLRGFQRDHSQDIELQDKISREMSMMETREDDV